MPGTKTRVEDREAFISSLLCSGPKPSGPQTSRSTEGSQRPPLCDLDPWMNLAEAQNWGREARHLLSRVAHLWGTGQEPLSFPQPQFPNLEDRS